MSILAVILVLAAGTQKPACGEARQKTKELNQVHTRWLKTHTSGCPLCARGSTCREGFERKSAVRKQFKDWNDVHVTNCRACMSNRCTALEQNRARWTKDARAEHQAKHQTCALDVKRCLSWKVAMGHVKRKTDLFKRDHPSVCTVCGPRCGLWRQHASEITGRYGETLKRHQDACHECKRSTGDCEQPGRFKDDWRKQRLTLWKVHSETCMCRTAALRR